jgi:uncharacterized membrane protein YdjX (TVP38/TMEM64 family)
MTVMRDPVEETKSKAGETELPPAPKRRLSVKRLIPVGILLTGLVAFFALELDRFLSYQTLVDNRDWLQMQVAENRALTYLAFMAIYAVVIAFSIPGGTIMTLAGGFLFGTWIGGSLTVLAATLGSTAVFLAARSALGGALRARAGGYLDRMEKGFQENALSYLLVLRLVPIFPFWLVNIVPALLGVPLRTYVLGTLAGIIPGTFVYASVGAGLGSLLDRGETPDFGIIFDPQVLLPLLALSALALLPVAYRRFKNRNAKA